MITTLLNMLSKFFVKNRIEKQEIKDELEPKISSELNYPVILLCHVKWDFDVFNTDSELIKDSVIGHRGVFPEPFDDEEIIIDAEGKIYEFSHKHHVENPVSEYLFPLVYKGEMSLASLKKRIIEGYELYEDYFDKNLEIRKKNVAIIKQMTSIKELILFVASELVLESQNE